MNVSFRMRALSSISHFQLARFLHPLLSYLLGLLILLLDFVANSDCNKFKSDRSEAKSPETTHYVSDSVQLLGVSDPDTSARASRYRLEPYRDTYWWCTYH